MLGGVDEASLYQPVLSVSRDDVFVENLEVVSKKTGNTNKSQEQVKRKKETKKHKCVKLKVKAFRWAELSDSNSTSACLYKDRGR